MPEGTVSPDCIGTENNKPNKMTGISVERARENGYSGGTDEINIYQVKEFEAFEE